MLGYVIFAVFLYYSTYPKPSEVKEPQKVEQTQSSEISEP